MRRQDIHRYERNLLTIAKGEQRLSDNRYMPKDGSERGVVMRDYVDDAMQVAPPVPAYVEPVVSPFTFRSSGIAERYEDGSAWGGFQDSWGTGK